MICFPLVSPWKSYQNITVLWGECVLFVYNWQTAIEFVFGGVCYQPVLLSRKKGLSENHI